MMDSLRNLVAQGKYDNDTKKTMLHIAEMWGAFMGAECEKQSMKYFWLEEGIEGDNLFVASTYRSIVDQLWQSVSQEVELRLSTEVIQIKDSGPERGVVVKTANGTAAFFDEVVVTLPLGWLKRNQDVICPPLPARISEAINAIGFGNLDKVFVNFPKPFWMVSNNSEKPNGEGSFPIETLFLTPTYASVTNPSCWRQEMVSLASLPKGYAHPTVMFYVYGEWGQHITRLVRSLEQDSPEYHQILKEKFEPYYSKLPNYQEDSPDCRPLRFLSSDWQGDKFAGYGSYCNYQVGLENGAEDIEVLRQGMGLERGIWFAGEHTAPFEGLGTVTGAYWSGER
ncbi:Flavin containing amine oxidoreductase-like protein 2 [Elsinoe fawcettii]|nr:Flavin containing amine oxidoreductase-like protein 2 [Elsinoe fawcettii]